MKPRSSKTEHRIKIQEELERRILHGLSCEWEEAIGLLDATHRQRMRPPLFDLGDMTGSWGTWSGEVRRITLSRDLVLNHSWDAVREVLLHEMAHQLAGEALDGDGETSHGPTFRKACLLLRANPEASGRFCPLDERGSRGPADADDRVMRRIRKLMALAESPNRNEAEAAMAKAHELLERFNLDLFERKEPRRFQSIFLGKPALRHFREDYLLALLLQDFYFVRGIWIPSYVIQKAKMGRVLEISGTLQNIQIAAYVYDFVRNFINVRWQTYNWDKRLNRYRKTDFAVGLLEGFRSKLETSDKERKRTQGRKKALVKTEDPMLTEYFGYRYPHTTSIRCHVSGKDREVKRDGEALGKKLVIHRGITSRTRGGRLLPGKSR